MENPVEKKEGTLDKIVGKIFDFIDDHIEKAVILGLMVLSGYAVYSHQKEISSPDYYTKLTIQVQGESFVGGIISNDKHTLAIKDDKGQKYLIFQEGDDAYKSDALVNEGDTVTFRIPTYLLKNKEYRIGLKDLLEVNGKPIEH